MPSVVLISGNFKVLKLKSWLVMKIQKIHVSCMLYSVVTIDNIYLAFIGSIILYTVPLHIGLVSISNSFMNIRSTRKNK